MVEIILNKIISLIDFKLAVQLLVFLYKKLLCNFKKKSIQNFSCKREVLIIVHCQFSIA
ncbi:hypothetical protein U732_4336 [Clostridium argentinense CDC 2741]|uniref:Uncharacterized protein n=1 Tax=Clostridium argentinense CDC 2741 TaxID=1418104 RepID=A0A0C1U713_9CLOT|nr:hypothetical protein U732_4336 [Clostridium argentinense CDC 2741]